MDAALSQIGDEGVAQGMEIHHTVRGVSVRDAGRRQVHSKDARDRLAPGEGEQRHFRLAFARILAEHRCRRRQEGERVIAPVL